MAMAQYPHSPGNVPTEVNHWIGTPINYHEVWLHPGASQWIQFMGYTGSPQVTVTANIYAWYDVYLAKNQVDYVIASGLPNTWRQSDGCYFQTWGNGTGGWWVDITQGIYGASQPDQAWPNLKADLIAMPTHPYPAARPVAEWGMDVNGLGLGIQWKGSAANTNITNHGLFSSGTYNTWGVAWGQHSDPYQSTDYFMCGQSYDGYLYHHVKIDNALKLGAYKSDGYIGAAPVL